MYEIIEKQAFKLVGISVRTSNANGQSGKDIGQLADTFFSQQLMNKIQNKIGDDIFFVYTDYESDQNAPYTCYIGCKVSAYKGTEAAFVRKYIKGGKFAVFKPTGKMPDALYQTWGRIWRGEDDLIRRYAADYDVYKGENIAICLSVK